MLQAEKRNPSIAHWFLCSHTLQKEFSQQFLALWPTLTTIWPPKMWVSELPECRSTVVIKTKTLKWETCDGATVLRMGNEGKGSLCCSWTWFCSATPFWSQLLLTQFYFSLVNSARRWFHSTNLGCWILVKCIFIILFFSQRKKCSTQLYITDWYLKSPTFDFSLSHKIYSVRNASFCFDVVTKCKEIIRFKCFLFFPYGELDY